MHNNIREPKKYVCILLHYCRCAHFLRDHSEKHYVLLHWYDETTNDFRPHVETKAIRLQLYPPDEIRSFGVMPADSVINGAYIVQTVGYYWVVQSPREGATYIEANIS